MKTLKLLIILAIIFVVFGFLLVGEIKAGTGDNVWGWAWSSNIGWISFNCADRGVCLTSDYKVMTSFISNNPPSATNLSVVQPDYCLSGPAAIFSWTFTDPDSGDSQSAYQVQVDNNSDFSSLEVDSGKVSSDSNSYATPPGRLQYNTPYYPYYWRVEVWDSKDVSSSWISGPSFSTPKHAYPTINFTWSPQTPPVNQAVTFTDQSQVFGGATKISWQWTFPDGNPPSATSQNATTTFSSLGSKQVTLRVTDSDNYSCPISKSVSIQLSLPEYKEVPPVIWLKNFFAGIVEFFNGFLRSING